MLVMILFLGFQGRSYGPSVLERHIDCLVYFVDDGKEGEIKKVIRMNVLSFRFL